VKEWVEGRNPSTTSLHLTNIVQSNLLSARVCLYWIIASVLCHDSINACWRPLYWRPTPGGWSLLLFIQLCAIYTLPYPRLASPCMRLFISFISWHWRVLLNWHSMFSWLFQRVQQCWAEARVELCELHGKDFSVALVMSVSVPVLSAFPWHRLHSTVAEFFVPTFAQLEQRTNYLPIYYKCDVFQNAYK